MEKHTMYLTQNLIDFLATMTFGQAAEVEKAYSERLQKLGGLSIDAADEAADDAVFELWQRVSQFKSDLSQ